MEQEQGSPLVSTHDEHTGLASNLVASILGAERDDDFAPNFGGREREDTRSPSLAGRDREEVRSPSLGGSQIFQQQQLQQLQAPLSILGVPVSPLRSAHAHHDGGAKTSSSSFVYEIIPEQFSFKVKENDYAGQQARAAALAPNAVINTIIESVAAGQIGLAYAKLHELQSGSPAEKAVARAPLVQRLMRHCEVVLGGRDPNAPVVTSARYPPGGREY
jgi:hypothetical protein